jgi:RNA polymerase sigma-70 factor
MLAGNISNALVEESFSLHDLFAAAFREAIVTHGDLGLSLGDYVERLQAIIQKCRQAENGPLAATRIVAQLHTSDLYLSTACARHCNPAWCRFDLLYNKYINDLIAYLCSAPCIAAEIRETISGHLFLPDSTGRSRIFSYDGRSSLATWLRVIVTNRIINEGERKCNSLHHDEPRPEFEDHMALPFIEGCLKVRRYEPLVCDAVQKACSALSEKERELVLLRFDRGVQLGDIARELGVHQSTVTRTLERIARKLRESVISSLSASSLDRAAIDECLSVLIDGSCQSVSILDFLRGGVAG